VLVVAFALLVGVSVGTRLVRIQYGSGPATMLIERATPKRVLPVGHLFLTARVLSAFRDPAKVLFQEGSAFNPLTPVDSLDGVLGMIVPFVALLIGSSMSPSRKSGALTCLSAPIRKWAYYVAHASALCGILLLLGVAGWLVGVATLIVGVPQPWDLLRLFTLMMGMSVIYAAVFGMAGLALSTLFSRPAAGLLVGLLVVVLLVGGMPALRESLDRTYAARHPEEYSAFQQGESIPRDPMWLLSVVVRHTPANAFRVSMWLIDAFSPVARPGCQFCGGLRTPPREYSIAREILSLGLASIAFLLVGCGAFLWKDQTT